MDHLEVKSRPFASLSSQEKDVTKKKEQGDIKYNTTKAITKTRHALQRDWKKAATAAREHPAVAVAVGVVATYTALRVGIEVFHHTRRRNLRHLLRDLCDALEKIGQDYWVDFGGLLGIHRDGDLIPHDNDVDLAVLNPDWETLLEGLRRHLPRKYAPKVITNQDTKTSWIRVYCPLGMADLFGAFDNGSKKIHIEFGHEDVHDVERDLIVPTGRETFRGQSIRVPHNVEGVLAFRYGPTWRTPLYMDKGVDTVESSKGYHKLLKFFGKLGLKL